MKTFSEAKGDTAVFTFGRFNPPTTGHEKLIKALDKNKVAGSPMYVYPSHSQNPKKDPLPHGRKVAYMKKMFPKYAKTIIVSKARNVFDIAVELHNKGHRAIIMVVGSDRVKEFDRLLNTYNGVDGRHGYYGFDDIKVVSAGERDPDAEGVTGMSASKMREAAQKNEFEQFKLGLPKGFKDSAKLFSDVRKFMGVNEQNWSDEEVLRDAYIRGEIWNVGDVVETKLGEEGTIVRKGTNYVVLEEGMKKVWLHDLNEKRAKKAVAGGKVQKLVTAFGYSFKGKNYKEIDMELVGIDNSSQIVTFNIIHPAEIFGNEMKIPFRTLRRGRFMATDTSKINEQDDKEKPKSDQAKKKDEFGKLQKAKRVAQLQLRIAQDQERVAKLSAQERKLTDGEKDKLKKYEKDIDKKDFIDRYGKEEGESIYYATLTKMAKGESIEEINLPALIKSVIHRATHPKGYAKMLQSYLQMVKDQGDKHSNKFYASRVATMFGMSSAFPLIDYINKLVKKGMLPMNLMAQYDQKESYNTLVKKIRGNSSQQLGIKSASNESIELWYSSDETIKLYQERYGDEWLKKLNSTYEKMLSKLPTVDN